MVMAAIQKNILEHISLMAQEQVQLEFQQQLQQMQMMQQQMQVNPQMAQNPQIQQQMQQMNMQIEARKSILIAEMTKDFADEENKIVSQFDNDPLIKLKAREIDLRAMENERKKKEMEERINLDKMKAMMNQSNQEDKLEQNEELAKLRAGISLAKMGVQQAKINFGGTGEQ